MSENLVNMFFITLKMAKQKGINEIFLKIRHPELRFRVYLEKDTRSVSGMTPERRIIQAFMPEQQFNSYFCAKWLATEKSSQFF